ncbi:hypothetical protein FF098_003030 [Parvularcula flava]|uniref:Uncharacterized protein n=1 Tax=Aquisalinus luteolus TaxID=1566827 RepID=A0A8J3A0M9_9PROT|nr:hypothetical protein [Aquisalinus luteolus]NHK26880.1 hypothetical protein [Aquisalinus luteolus]GGH93692.1 hypothetical protein GCM10011355_06130 [Aquisalinus luteolus]
MKIRIEIDGRTQNMDTGDGEEVFLEIEPQYDVIELNDVSGYCSIFIRKKANGKLLMERIKVPFAELKKLSAFVEQYQSLPRE